MARTIELLLLESVENQGIVGDVVKARLGYARNYLLPRNLATKPSKELIEGLQAKRAEAQRQVAELREQRAQTVERLKGFELTVERSCNDQGILYASVTQQEISAALNAAGYAVRPRDIRLSGAIKRVDNYEVHVKYETDLETWIKLHIKADRPLPKDEQARTPAAEPAEPVAEPQAEVADKPGKKPAKHPGEEPAGHKGGEKSAKKGEEKPGKDKKAAAAEADGEPAKKATKKPREDAKKAHSAKESKKS